MKRIHLNGFKFAGIGHTAVGVWRHPDNQAYRYTDLDYWLETARVLEAGMFDSLFLADFLGIPDKYSADPGIYFREAIHVPINDPLMIIAAMGAVTKHLGFGVTVSTTYEQPYSFARKMATLDHLTKGRIGWNVVTSASGGAARNLGLGKQVPHDERYAIADEFLEVAYKLWEGSWDDDAIVFDRENGVFADPAKIRPVDHHGKYYSVSDPFQCQPSIQRTPLLFQAGASEEGKKFAAKHAEAVFINNPNVAGQRKLIREVRELAEKAGRDPASLKFMSGLSVVVAETDAEAQKKYEEQIGLMSEEGTLARQGELMGLDFSGADIDQPLSYIETDGIRYALERFTKGDTSRVWTPRQVAQFMSRTLGGITIVGSAATIADKMEEMMEASEADGFNISDPMPQSSFPDFVDYVVPELQRRQRVWREYEGTTLRESVLGAGQKRLRDDHPGAHFRSAT